MSVKRLRERLAILREAGLEVIEVIDCQGAHKKVRVLTPDGREALVVVTPSASCYRADRNLRSDARKIAAGQPTNGRHKPSDAV